MIPFNKEQQRSFVEKTCTLASEKGWKRLFGEILVSTKLLVSRLLHMDSVFSKSINCPNISSEIPSYLHGAGSKYSRDGSTTPVSEEALKHDSVGFSFVRTPVYA